MSDPNTMPPPSDPTPDPVPGAPAAEPTKDERTMALLAHLLGIILSVIGPLIIWVMKKDESPFVDDQGKEAMNFQITALFAWVVVMILAAVTCGIGGLLALPLFIAVLIFCIIGGMKANDGQRYRYPVAVRLIK